MHGLGYSPGYLRLCHGVWRDFLRFAHRSAGLVEFTQELATQFRELAVVGVVMGVGADRVNDQLRRKGWKMPVLNGSALRLIYGVEFTPRLVMIDAEGVIQGIVTGWGSESAAEVQAIRKRWRINIGCSPRRFSCCYSDPAGLTRLA